MLSAPNSLRRLMPAAVHVMLLWVADGSTGRLRVARTFAFLSDAYFQEVLEAAALMAGA